MVDDDLIDLEEGEKELSQKYKLPPSGLASRKGSFKDTIGRFVVLTQKQAIEAWNDYVLGANVLQIALKFRSSPTLVEEALTAVATELGFPDKHLDPEMERFRIAEASDRIKDSITRILGDSNTVIASYTTATKALLGKQTLTDLLQSEDVSDQDKVKTILALNAARQAELKVVNVYLAEYRQINNTIADITGVKKIKIARQMKKVNNAEDVIDKLTDEELKALAANT